MSVRGKWFCSNRSHLSDRGGDDELIRLSKPLKHDTEVSDTVERCRSERAGCMTERTERKPLENQRHVQETWMHTMFVRIVHQLQVY